MHRWSSPFETFSRCDIERISTLCCSHFKRGIFPYSADTRGVNDILRGQSELKQQLVLQNIMKIAHQCRDHGVKEIILSSVLDTGRVNANVLILFNESFKNLCRENGFCFVNNDDISGRNLYKDRLHLLKAVKHMLANNFINGINNNYFLLKHRENNHFLTKDTNKDTHFTDCTNLQT